MEQTIAAFCERPSQTPFSVTIRFASGLAAVQWAHIMAITMAMGSALMSRRGNATVDRG
jgi:hypothetical protein